jgi:hypothetical protein
MMGASIIGHSSQEPGYEVALRPVSNATSFPGSLGKTLVSAGHVPRPKLIARGGVVKVSNYKQLKT